MKTDNDLNFKKQSITPLQPYINTAEKEQTEASEVGQDIICSPEFSCMDPLENSDNN